MAPPLLPQSAARFTASIQFQTHHHRFCPIVAREKLAEIRLELNGGNPAIDKSAQLGLQRSNKSMRAGWGACEIVAVAMNRWGSNTNQTLFDCVS